MKQKIDAVPAGFTPVATGQFPPNHDFKANPVCAGDITQIKESQQKRGAKTEKVKILYVADVVTGEIEAVWESSALKDFMTQVKPGDSVFIKFEGVQKLKGKKTLKKFTCAYKSKGKK